MAAQILHQRECGLLQVYEIEQQSVSLFLLLPKSQGGTACNVGEYYRNARNICGYKIIRFRSFLAYLLIM